MKPIIWLFLIVTRLRNRLRCPACGAVGTYKLHARGNGRPFRWLCKWCGYYKGPEGIGLLCAPSITNKCWVFKEEYSLLPGKTPAEIIKEHGNFWPWRG